MTKKILLTGFEPFGQYRVNPSEVLAKDLHGETITSRRMGRARIDSLIVPYDSRNIKKHLLDEVHRRAPEIVIMLGQSFRHDRGPQLERFAHNRVDYAADGLTDNTGYAPPVGEIVAGGRARLETTYDLEQMMKNMYLPTRTAAVISEDAGRNFCNETYYHLLADPHPAQKLFIHLPPLPMQEAHGVDREVQETWLRELLFLAVNPTYLEAR